MTLELTDFVCMNVFTRFWGFKDFSRQVPFESSLENGDRLDLRVCRLPVSPVFWRLWLCINLTARKKAVKV